MIGVEGQYILWLDIGGEKDFLDEDFFISITLIEEAGNLLPTFELKFNLQDDNMLRLFNEGNVIKLHYGIAVNDETTTELLIMKKSIQKTGKHKYYIRLTGTLSAIRYIGNHKIRSFADKSGVEVIKEIATENFGGLTKFNVAKSADKQTWLQPNIPDKRFLNDVWMHSTLPASFPAIGISIDGYFILKDIMKDIQEFSKDPVWKLINKSIEDKQDVLVDANYIVSTESGFFNHWLGYCREQSLRTLESAEDTTTLPEVSPLLATDTSTLDRSTEVTKRVSEFGLLGDNVHEKYWESYWHNMTHLAMFSSVKLFVSYPMRMLSEMRILDLVNFEDEQVGSEMLSSDYSGLYYITKLSRTIAHKHMSTSLELSKESLSSIKGDLQ